MVYRRSHDRGVVRAAGKLVSFLTAHTAELITFLCLAEFVPLRDRTLQIIRIHAKFFRQLVQRIGLECFLLFK